MNALIENLENLKEESKKFCHILDNNYLYYNRWFLQLLLMLEVYSVDTILRDLIRFEWDSGYNNKIDEIKFKEYCCMNFISKMQYSKFLSI